jgi:DNA end-binding protein Ku
LRSILNATLSFGLMNVPVGVATAAKRHEFEFRTLHRECGTPIKQNLMCEVCNKHIGLEECEKGFEFAKGTFVMLDTDELKKLGAQRDRVIQLRKFVPFDQVPELQVEKSYLLTPNDKLPAPYSLISESLIRNSVVAIGPSALWGKESPCMVWPTEQGSLALSMLFCHDEVVSENEIISVLGKGVTEEMQVLADQFVGLNIGNLEPEEDLVSDSRNRIDEYISAKVQGLPVELTEPSAPPEVTIDINEMLRKSIEAVR